MLFRSGSFGGMPVFVTKNLPSENRFLDIGGALYGPYMRIAILTSIVVSQLGFVSAYTIFVAENLRVGYSSAPSKFWALTSFVGFRHGRYELHEDCSSPVFHSDAARYFPAVCAHT